MRTYRHFSVETITFAKQLRRSGNPAEKLLWSKIRNGKFFGLKFRKQVPCGPYIVDFLCTSRKFIIEIDGDSHYEDGRQEYDKKRDTYVQQHGFTVLRTGHREIVQNINGVLERMRLFLGLEYYEEGDSFEPSPLSPP